MALGRYKLPIIPEPRVVRGDFDQPTPIEYDEVIYDYRTNRYLTLSQQNEIDRLQKELEIKEKKRNDSVKSIIGYFYKSR
jgi:hypothetical protein